jgi:hypothetical protein
LEFECVKNSHIFTINILVNYGIQRYTHTLFNKLRKYFNLALKGGRYSDSLRQSSQKGSTEANTEYHERFDSISNNFGLA